MLNDQLIINIYDLISDKTDGINDDDDEKKSLPELDKYWKSVNDDPTDFTAWTYLLQYVDQEVRLIVCFLMSQLI